MPFYAVYFDTPKTYRKIHELVMKIYKIQCIRHCFLPIFTHKKYEFLRSQRVACASSTRTWPVISYVFIDFGLFELFQNVDHKAKFRSKRGQLPFVELNGEEIADSAYIIKDLSEKFNKDLDACKICFCSLIQVFIIILLFRNLTVKLKLTGLDQAVF